MTDSTPREQELGCICASGPMMEGPLPECSVHGEPQAAYRAGLAEGQRKLLDDDNEIAKRAGAAMLHRVITLLETQIPVTDDGYFKCDEVVEVLRGLEPDELSRLIGFQTEIQKIEGRRIAQAIHDAMPKPLEGTPQDLHGMVDKERVTFKRLGMIEACDLADPSSHHNEAADCPGERS